MTGKDAVEKFLGTLVQVETQKVLPKLAELIPGAVGAMASEVLSLPAVQAKIAQVETQAVDGVVEFLAKEVDALKGYVQEHVKGRLGAVVDAVLKVSPPGAEHLTADDIRYLAVLASGGDLTGMLKQAAKDLVPGLVG